LDPKNPFGAASDISVEVGLLDDARRALAKGDTGRALSALDAHAERFGHGVLAEEAEVLRIQTLLKAGKGGQAQQRAQDYLSDHPESPHAGRVRSMLKRHTRRTRENVPRGEMEVLKDAVQPK
jgi:outer membrane protein assembly factor BamD (BamD/ComL family)